MKKKAAPRKQAMTPQQKLFVREYLVDLNATQAAIRAGYSKKSSQVLGYQLLQLPLVRASVQELLKLRYERLDLTAERILLELFRCATVDLAGAYDTNGNLLPIQQMPEDVRRAISSVESEQELVPGTGDEDCPPEMVTVKKIKLVDKNRSLEMLAKYFKLLSEKVEHEHKFTLADLVAGSMEEEK